MIEAEVQLRDGAYSITFFFRGGAGGGGGGIRPPLRILCPPLETPPKKIVLE